MGITDEALVVGLLEGGGEGSSTSLRIPFEVGLAVTFPAVPDIVGFNVGLVET